MTKKISFFVVTAAAVALVLSGCSRGPGMDDMEPDDMATVPAHIGTWYFADPMPDDDILVPPGARLVLEEAKFTITAGDGNAPIGMEAPYNAITMIVVTGDFEVADAAFTLAVSDDGVDATFAAGVTTAEQEVLSAAILAGLQVADNSPVMVTISEDGNTMTLEGAFIVSLLKLPADTPAVMACKDMACPDDGDMAQ